MGSKTKLTKKEKRKLELLRLKQDPAFFLRQRLKGLGPVASHIGESFAEGKLTGQLLDLGLALAGIQTFRNWKGALIGPIGIRLATSPGGTPPIGQMAGLAMLAYLGVATAGWQFGSAPRIDAEGKITMKPIQIVDKKQADEDAEAGKTVRPIPWYPGLWTSED